MGFGTAGFSEHNSLLSTAGYGGVKMWFTIDGAYMLHRHFGLGLWTGMNLRKSHPNSGPSLSENAYFVGLQAPILIAGKRAYALHITPRLAFATGQLELDNDKDAKFQNTAMWGGAVSFTSFTYHVGGSLGLMRAQTGPPGEIGRDYDYGGFYVALEGTIDG